MATCDLTNLVNNLQVCTQAPAVQSSHAGTWPEPSTRKHLYYVTHNGHPFQLVQIEIIFPPKKEKVNLCPI